MTTIEGHFTDPGGRIAIVAGRFNEFVTSRLIAGCEDALRRHGVDPSDRVDVIDFQRLVRDPAEVITAILAGVGHRHDQFNPDVLNTAISAAFARQNERTGGYQLQESSTWSAQDRELLHEAQESINERVRKLYV
jgi:hypothetical protein